MKKQFFSCLLVILSFNLLQACDICGCGIGTASFGILPRFQGHFIGIRSQFRSFDSYHPPLFADSESQTSKEKIFNLELWSRIAVGKRVQLYLNLPYQSIQKIEEGSSNIYSGMSDIAIMANYIAVNQTDESEYDLLQAFQLGSGIKLPTGKRNIAEKDGYIIRNLQPGIGAFAIPFNAIYTIRKGKFGLHTEFNYQHFLKDKNGYQFGSRFQQSAGAFMMIRKGTFTMLPNVGMNYAFADRDSKKGVPYETSGGQTFSGRLGYDVYWRSLSLGLQGQLPIWQHNVNGNVKSKTQLQVTLLFNF